MVRLLAGFIFCICITNTIFADMFMKQNQHTDSFTVGSKTEPPKDELVDIWMSEKGLRSDGELQSILIKLDTKTVYIIDHQKKKYSEVPFNLFESSGSGNSPQVAGLPEFMAGMMKMNITITPTDESKTIGKYNCKKYIQKMQNSIMNSESELWVTKDININIVLYKKYLTSMLAVSSGMKQILGDLANELEKIDGIYVYSTSVSTVMNNQIKSTTEIKEIKEGSAPAGTFELPSKYKKTDWNK